MLLPYQSAPVMVALQLANIRLASGTKLSLLLGGLTLLVLVPLDYAWWEWLGRLE
jgi:di/tricarboxylate transporter